jgi:uncharacterized phage protein (TIGR02218 family)
MSKTIPALMLTHYGAAAQTLAQCITITRTDAVVLRYTSLDVPLVVAGNTYQAAGLNVSGLATSSGLSVNNAELQILPDAALGIVRADLITGKWDHASFTLFETNWKTPTDGINTLMVGALGEVRPARGIYTVELRSLAQVLQNPVGASTSKTCRYRLGSVALPQGLCNLALGPFTKTGTLTSAASRQVFTDTARTEADDYFGDGLFTWTGGANSGYSEKIKTYAADTFTLVRPAPFAVVAGDTYTAIAGCRKRLAEDCIAKFANELNFGGEPHLPGVDAMLRAPVTSV